MERECFNFLAIVSMFTFHHSTFTITRLRVYKVFENLNHKFCITLFFVEKMSNKTLHFFSSNFRKKKKRYYNLECNQLHLLVIKFEKNHQSSQRRHVLQPCIQWLPNRVHYKSNLPQPSYVRIILTIEQKSRFSHIVIYFLII